MPARVLGYAVIGLQGVLVEVEVDSGQGQHDITIVSLQDTAVQESFERVLASIRNVVA